MITLWPVPGSLFKYGTSLAHLGRYCHVINHIQVRIRHASDRLDSWRDIRLTPLRCLQQVVSAP